LKRNPDLQIFGYQQKQGAEYRDHYVEEKLDV